MMDNKVAAAGRQEQCGKQPREWIREGAAALLDADSALADSQPLYRILDCFAAAQLIQSAKLRFSRADTFADPNEGIERLLQHLEISGPAGGCLGAGWSDLQTAAQHHDLIKRSHYASCWTEVPESVAAWMLYSPDTNGVRISTTVGKLKVALLNLMTEWSIGRLSQADVGKRVRVVVSGRLGPVRYESLPDLSRKIHRRVKAYGRIVERYERAKKPLPGIDEIDRRYFEREERRRLTRNLVMCNLKDASFTHEHEVRATVRFGEEDCDARMLEEQKPLIDPTNEYHGIARASLSVWGWVRSGLDPFLFSTCPEAFVDSVALDPRCPPHRREFMTTWFEKQNIRLEESHCFGYIPTRFTVFPSW